jgi:hypothetical protein
LSKDFSGGSPEIGLESQSDGSASHVLVTSWDPSAHDSFVDLLRDHIASGGDPWQFCSGFFETEIRARTSAAVKRTLLLIRDSNKPKLAVDQIAWTCGLALMEGETVGTLAKAHGISKQAFQQGAERFRRLLNVRSQTRRDDCARQNMKKANYGKFKIKSPGKV